MADIREALRRAKKLEREAYRRALGITPFSSDEWPYEMTLFVALLATIGLALWAAHYG